MSLDREVFFERMEQQGLALTFDDVRIVTGASNYSPNEIDLTSRFSRNIEIKAPFISAAMDTVTTADMASAMAKMGGLGVMHAGLTPRQQGKEARKVKHELNTVIEKPISFDESWTVQQVLSYCDEHDYSFRTFPVISSEGVFVGLLTQNDFDLNNDDTGVVIADLMTSRDEVVTGAPNDTPAEAFLKMKEHKKKTLPLLNVDGTVAGMYVLSDVVRSVQENPKKYSLDKLGRLLVAAAVPTDGDEALERIDAMKDYLDVAVIDSAQGDSRFAFETLKVIKSSHPNLDVVVGNVSSAGSAKMLIDAGADGIKVGQGPGSICTTRIETGIGTPQVTAVYECVKAIRGSDVPVCADGGIVNKGDVSIAIASGASTVMMGGQLAGTKESPGDITTHNGQMVKLYRGMGSPSALRDSEASRRRYGVDKGSGSPLAEGVESYVQYKGSVVEVVDQIAKALRKSMSYVGSGDIEQHRTQTRFTRVTNAGMRESKPHDVAIIQAQ